jgi:FemAB-related protein (PEP-CTERM system-associated)
MPTCNGNEDGIAISADIGGEEWDRYVTAHPDGTVDHLWGWRDLMPRVFGHECQYLVARRAGAVVGVLPLVLFRSRLFGRSVVSMPFLNYGGVLGDDDAVAGALADRAAAVARQFSASYVELRHQQRRLATTLTRQHKLGLVRALPPTVDELWTQTDRKVRNQVRKGQKEGLTVHEGGPELVDAFYAVFCRNMRDLGTPVYSKRLFSETLRVFPDRARVFVVRAGEQPVAAGIAIGLGGTILVPWASSLREFRSRCPNMLLYWTMLERAVQQGMRKFDFGRSSPGGGTHHFKLQWGAEAHPLHWEYLQITGEAPRDTGAANPTFSAAISAWQHLPLPLANLIGPAVVRHIP